MEAGPAHGRTKINDLRKGLDVPASTELEEWVSQGGIPQRVEQFARALDIESSLDTSGVNRSTLQIMERILAAETAEAVFAAANAGATAGKDFVNRPFLLKGDAFEWKKSAAMFREQGGFPFYALMTVVDYQTGAEEVVTCGGFSFCSTLWRLAQIGVFETFEDGMPLQIIAKAVPSGAVLLLNPFTIPTQPKRSGTKATA